MNITGLICILLAQYLCGYGMLRLLKVQLAAVPAFCMSMITGIAIISLVPCILQLLHIEIIAKNTAIGIGLMSAIFSIPIIVFFKKPQFGKISLPQLYELPFIIVFLLFVIISSFRCFYFPPTPRDVLAGAELLAEFTVREKTMLNSVFDIDLRSTNNHFKSPFLTSMQVIYKLFVCPFGQVWLTTIFVPFLIMLYTILKDRLHGLVACFLLLLYLAIPDMFAYSYIMLYDYSNMLFFFTGYYFLMQHLIHKRNTDFALSVLLLGIATYIRVETLVLIGFAALMPAFIYYKEKVPIKTILIKGAILMGVSVFFYVLCMNIFIANIVPVSLDTTGQLNKNLGDISVFFSRISSINELIIFSEKGILVYGYFIYMFIILVLLDLVLIRKFNKEARMALYGIAVVYFGLAFLGYLLPLFDILNTTKRGLFKLIPLIIIYMSNSGLVMKVSDYLKNRENRVEEKGPLKPAVAAPVQKGKKK
jgi:hypothetical protein